MPDRGEAATAAPEAAERADDVAEASDQPIVGRWVTPAPSDRSEFLRENARTLVSVGLLAAGVVFVMLGWYGAAHTNILTEQIPYLISGGLLGLGLIIVAGFMASSALLERRTEQLRRDLIDAMRMMPAGESGSNGSAVRASGSATVYALSDGHSYHLGGCPIIEGKDTRALGVREAIGAGLAPCKLCGPE